MVRRFNFLYPFILLLCLVGFTSVKAQSKLNSNLQTDSLKKLSVDELLRRTYNDANIKVYLTEISNRKLSDHDKSKFYNILGFRYFFEVQNDYSNTFKYLHLSNYYAEKTENKSLERANLNLIALLYAQQNKNKEALHYIDLRNKIVLDHNDEFQELLDSGDDDVIYSMIGNFDKAITSYRKAVESIENYLRKNKDLSNEKKYQLNYYKCFKYNNLAMNYNYLKKLDSSAYYIDKIKKSGISKQEVNQLVWSTEINYLILSGKLNEAIVKTKAADHIFKGVFFPNSYKHYFLARAYQLKGMYKQSLEECEKGLKNIVVNIDFINIELELYQIAMLCAQKTNDKDAYLKYSNLYLAKKQIIDYDSKANFIFKLYKLDQIEPLNSELNKSKNTGIKVIIGSVLFLTICFSLYYLIIVKRKTDIKTESFESEISNVISERKNVEVVIQDDTEKEILRKLEIFERKNQFLSNEVSLSFLSTKLDTNFNYLSTIIKKHKGKNFNGYINQLRINYIKNKLENSPEYLTYKISYLAEECGFSSHTTFTRIFMKETGMPPSQFIDYIIKKDN